MKNMTVFDINTLQLSASQHLFKGVMAVERKETQEIADWLSTAPAESSDNRICLLTGTAGMGKTVVLQNLLQLMGGKRNYQLYALKADLVDFDNITTTDYVTKYAEEFRLLSNNGINPVLVIDQIDALSKTLSTDRKPINLLDQLINAVLCAERACVIVSCRPYDLNFDPLLSKYKYKKKINLQPLSHGQVNEVLRTFGMREYAEESKMAEFLSVPINLELFLEYGKEDEHTVTLQSLMDTLWRTKISEVSNCNKQLSTEKLIECLDAISSSLNKSPSLACSRKVLDDKYTKEANYLISENILVESARSGYVSFAHQSLADYISARLLTLSGQTMAKLLENEHQGLYIRNRVKQYFAYIREADTEKYLLEIKEILVDNADKYRVHIKMLLLTAMAGFEQPIDEEKHFVGQNVLPDENYLSIFVDAIYRKEWFEYITNHPYVRKGLKERDENIISMIKSLCENVMLYDTEVVVNYMAAQKKDGDASWNRQWMEITERYDAKELLRLLIPLYEQSIGNEPLLFSNYLEHLALYEYEYVEARILEDIHQKLKKEMAEKDKENFLLRVVFLNNSASSLLEKLFERYKEKAADTYLKAIRLIDDGSSYDRDDVFIHQESRAYFAYSPSSYYSNHDRLVGDYLEYAKQTIVQDADRMRNTVRECLHDPRCIVYYVGLCMCRLSPEAYKHEALAVLTDKTLLEELDGKVSYQLVNLLGEVFPLLDDAEKEKVMEVITKVDPQWEHTPLPDMHKYNSPLYHIGRRKQELLTALPKEYLHDKRKDDWQFLQQMVREHNEAEMHEPYRMQTKSGWSAHSLETLKAMKMEDMLRAFRKYESNMPGFDERPTRQGECMNFQKLVTEVPDQYVKVIEAILVDRSINREYAAYGIIGLMKAEYDLTTIQSLTDMLIGQLMSDLVAQENHYALMDVLREIDFFIKKDAVTPAMLDFMCRIVKEYPEESHKGDNLETRQDVYNTGINRARGNAAYHLVMCYKMKDYGDDIMQALESCVENASPATKGAIILQQALLNHIDPDRNYNLYMKMVKDLTPSLVSIPLNNLHPLLYFINAKFREMIPFFKGLMNVKESHEMLAQLLWIAWVRGKEGAKELLHDMLMQSDTAKLSIIRYFSKEIVKDYYQYIMPVVEWCGVSNNENVGRAYDYLVNDFEDLEWDKIKAFVNVYTKSKTFGYANHQFLDFMHECAASHPEDVLEWMCIFAYAEHKGDSHVFTASRSLSNLVAAYNAIRKYDKNNHLLEKALDTMDVLMELQSVRRDIRRFLYELDNK